MAVSLSCQSRGGAASAPDIRETASRSCRTRCGDRRSPNPALLGARPAGCPTSAPAAKPHVTSPIRSAAVTGNSAGDLLSLRREVDVPAVPVGKSPSRQAAGCDVSATYPVDGNSPHHPLAAQRPLPPKTPPRG